MVKHAMVDIETLGTRPGAPILSIGVVVFDKDKITGEWECNIDLQSSFDAGCKAEASTIYWWMRQSGLALQAAFGNEFNSTPLKDALTSLYEYLQDEGVKFVWSHGATFDIPMLTEAARMVGVEPLVDYRSARDTRTLYEIADINPRDFRNGTAHKAIDDSRAQALAVMQAWRVIDGWKKGKSSSASKDEIPMSGVSIIEK